MASDGRPPAQGKRGEEAPGTAASPGGHDPENPRFECCVCLELLYKPVVIACGHMSCFWCVHKAMHGFRESHCAVCRQPYKHFPSICQLMHHLLLKLEPVDYKRREKEVLEEERLMQTYSPQIIDFVDSKNNVEKDGEDRLEDNKIVSSQEVSSNGNIVDEHSNKVKLDDVSCPLCKELLYQPAVLNCGHVYCISCLPSLNEEELKCQVCGSLHPGDFPNVCLDLDHFLEEYFPAEYESRRNKVQLKNGPCNREGSSSGTSCTKESSRAQLDDDLFNIHIGVGCDSCGVYPIRGKRYKCQDCTELIGFDLCEACYNTRLILPGRFNQQHTPDHRMELDDTALLQRFMRFRGIPEDGVELIMQEAFVAPGAMVQIVVDGQGIPEEGPEEPMEDHVAPGAMVEDVVDGQQPEDNAEEDQVL
ncbi:hypothetical protein ACP4OV_006236 [Aristida adscensionis]